MEIYTKTIIDVETHSVYRIKNRNSYAKKRRYNKKT